MGELAAFSLLSLMKDHLALPGRLRAERRKAEQQALAHTFAGSDPQLVVPPDMQRSVLHPFLGYVEDPSVPHELAYSQQGFSIVGGQGRVPPKERFTVAIFGGSVAQHLCLGGAEVLRGELSRLPQAAGRKVWIECYALGGYKQPQQVLALAYALARGERFDLVLNLDGFNDVALPVAENLPYGVNPYYPRSWHVTAAAAMDLDILRRAGEVTYLEGRRARSVTFLERTPLRYSALAHVAWKAVDRLARQRITDLEIHASALPFRRSYQRCGPPYPPRPKDEVFRDLAAFWGRSSRLMDGLCRARGIHYFHFLQPNQYVAGSKPMGAAERKIAIPKSSLYGRGARRGYRELIAAGRGLRREGERYFDLTTIFARVREPLYVDECCHLNPDGTERLAREIAARVNAALDLPATKSAAKRAGSLPVVRQALRQKRIADREDRRPAQQPQTDGGEDAGVAEGQQDLERSDARQAYDRRADEDIEVEPTADEDSDRHRRENARVALRPARQQNQEGNREVESEGGEEPDGPGA